jgi:hypothetical protein
MACTKKTKRTNAQLDEGDKGTLRRCAPDDNQGGEESETERRRRQWRRWRIIYIPLLYVNGHSTVPAVE